MKIINLRWMYPHYRHDEFVEVSDEVWEAMRQAEREMRNYDRRKVYHRAYYSLDAYSWTENYALEHGRSPEEIVMEQEERATRFRLVSALPEALSRATPTQGRRIVAYYIAGIKQPEISRREGAPMQTINLKKYYYPLYKQDTFLTVSDEVAEALLLMRREENNHARKVWYHKAYFSLDREDGIENEAIGWIQPSPEDYVMELEEQAEQEELVRRLYEALSTLTPMQARRIHARYLLGMKVKEIAEMEGVHPARVSECIHSGLRRLQKYFERQKWTGSL